MTKEAVVTKYINDLKININKLQSDEQNEILEFYSEFILDSDMQTREDIVSELGTPKKLARKILADYSIANEDNSAGVEVEKEQKKTKPKKDNQLKTILIIIVGLLAIPTAIPVALGLLGAVFGLFVGVFGIFLGFLAVIAGLVLIGIMLVVAAFSIIFTSWPVGLFFLGLGLIATTFGLLIAPGAYYIIRLLINAITSFVRFVGRKFFNKQYYQSKEEK